MKVILTKVLAISAIMGATLIFSTAGIAGKHGGAKLSTKMDEKCWLAMRSPLPPKGSPAYKNKRERKMLNMLKAAKNLCKTRRVGMAPSKIVKPKGATVNEFVCRQNWRKYKGKKFSSRKAKPCCALAKRAEMPPKNTSDYHTLRKVRRYCAALATGALDRPNPAERKCIANWRKNKGKKFSSERVKECCNLARKRQVPPRTSPAWKGKGKKDLRVLVRAKKYCARVASATDKSGQVMAGKNKRKRNVCVSRKRARYVKVNRVLSEARAISYEQVGKPGRTAMGFSNKRSNVCVGRKKVPVRVGRTRNQSNLGKFIKADMKCMLSTKVNKKTNRRQVAQLLCN